MSFQETVDEDDPGAWVHEADEQRAAADFRAMIRHRARFERAAYESEKSLGRELTRDEYRSLWGGAAGET